MSYKPSDPYCKEFTTANPSTGAAQNADSLPVATANRNGTDDAAFVLTVTNLDTGRYKITGTVPNTYAKGDVVNVTVAATVNSVAGKACVDTFVLDSKRVGDLNDVAATAIVSGGAITTGGGKVSEVALVDTLTTYAGNTPQTGDAFARLGAPAGASVSADVAAVKSDTGTILTDVNTGAGAIYARIGAPAGASIAADIAAVKTDTGNLVTRITSTLFSGITSLGKWLGLLAGSTADAGTLAEVNATTAGASYSNTTASLQALRARGDAAWVTATGFASATVAPSWYTAPVDVSANVSAIKAKTDNLPADPASDTQVNTRMATFALPTNFAALSIDTNGRVEVQSGVTKNAALANFEFLMVQSGDHVTPATGLTVAGTRSIDGGAFGACANAVTEVGSGVYKINLAASDLNGATITFRFTASGADDRFVTIVTSP